MDTTPQPILHQFQQLILKIVIAQVSEHLDTEALGQKKEILAVIVILKYELHGLQTIQKTQHSCLVFLSRTMICHLKETVSFSAFPVLLS